MRVLTNNPLVRQKMANDSACTVEYCAGTLSDVLIRARDQIHLGYRLYTHPLSGSVKPNETPYKSIGLSDAPEKAVCTDSLLLMEHSLAVCSHLAAHPRPASPDMLKDFQLVDLTLILSALEGRPAGHAARAMAAAQADSTPASYAGQPLADQR